MKALKNIFLLVLVSLFLLSACVGTQPSKPVITKPVPKVSDIPLYTKRDCWKSLFNPHQILHEWPKLFVKPLSNMMVVVVAGNPKINWEENNRKRQHLKMPVPEGEIAAIIIFVFVTIDGTTTELGSFGYKDKHGVSYIYALDMGTNCYILKITNNQEII